MRFILFTMCVLFAGQSAIAADSIEGTSQQATPLSEQQLEKQNLSEFNYVPAQGTGRFKVAPEVFSSVYKSTSNYTGRSYEKKFSGTGVGLEYKLGLENMAWSFGTSFGNSKSSVKDYGSDNAVDFKFSGISDLEMELTYISDKNSSQRILMGSGISLSPGKGKFATESSNGNRLSGGHSLSPFLAFENLTSFGAAGGKFQYSHFEKREFEADNGYSGSKTGGDIISLGGFAELASMQNKFGSALKLNLNQDASITDNEDGEASLDGSQSLDAQVYGHFPIGQLLALKPVLGYHTLLSKDINDQKVSQSDNTSLSFEILGTF